MTTPYVAYNRGAIAIAEHFDIGRVSASDFVLDHNPYPKDENAGWTLFKPSDDLDYEALDGREAKLVHRDGVEAKLVNRDRVEVTLTMRRDTSSVQPASAPPAWDAPDCLVAAFFAAWRGQSGWSLYIKGDLPTKRVTADTLEPGDIVNLHKDGTSETWEYAVCVAPGKIAVADDNRTIVLHRNLENITVTRRYGKDPAYKEEA